MAAGIAKRDTGRARRGHDKPDQQLVRPDRSSHKRRRSAKDDDEDEETIAYRRKRPRIQEILNKTHQEHPQRVISKPPRRSPRLRDIQDVNGQRTARGGRQTRSSPKPIKTQQYSRQRQALKQDHSPKEKDKGQHKASFTNLGAQKSTKRRSRVNDEDESNHNAKRARHSLAQCTEENLQKDSEAEAKADEPKGVCPLEQPQELPPLSEEDLQTLYKEVMDSAANNTLALKRTSSRRSIAPSEADTVQSQRSSNTTAYYRYKHLAAADVYIHTDPPDDIQDAIDRIVKAKVSKDRRVKLRDIAKELYEACKETVQAAAGEDDFVDLFYTALKAMAPDNIFFRAKADWREELKPIIKRSDLNLSFLVNFKAADSDQQQEVDDASAPPPPKRQQQSAGQTYMSPQSSMTDALDSAPDNRPPQSDTMPPPASRPLPEKVKETSLVKTPRPDLSMGTKETALISALSALSSQHLNNTGAKRFLEKLEDTIVPSERGRPAEPLLIAVPTQRASDLVFPFAVVEGKAYSTGKQIFEAQNQAAVSGASGLKIQLSLNELVKRSTSDVAPSPSKDQPPLFFSICTEGPYHELWAHYTHIEDDVRKFNMKLVKICNGVLLEGVEDFIATVDNVLRWGTGRFLESVVERLGKVARKAGA